MPLDACLVDELVQKCMLPVIEAAWDTGGKEVAQQVGEASLILSICGKLHQLTHCSCLAFNLGLDVLS